MSDIAPLARPPSTALRVMLTIAAGAAAWLVKPYADVLLIAAVVAILAWPLHKRLSAAPSLHAGFATGLSLLLLTVGAVAPATGLVWLVSRELVALAKQLTAGLDAGGLDAWVRSMTRVPVVAWAIEQGGGADAVLVSLKEAARAASVDLGSALGSLVPGILGITSKVLLKVAIFYLALATYFHRGRELSRWVLRFGPLPPEQLSRLFEVFSQMSRNVVLAGLVSAAVQSVVAGVGYALGGVERPILFAVLTGVLSFVPLIGTLVAWGPVALLLLLNGKAGGALFVVGWSILLTGTVDNLVKPLIVRGKSHVPTLLVFLGVFGGLAWLGVVGLFAGPVIMAMLLTLVTFYEESQGEVAPPTA